MQGPKSSATGNETRKVEEQDCNWYREHKQKNGLCFSFSGIDKSASPRLMKLNNSKAVN
jgi:hypothetical protein